MMRLCCSAGDLPGDRAEGGGPAAPRRPAAPSAEGTGSCGVPAGGGAAAVVQAGGPEGRPGQRPAAAAAAAEQRTEEPPAGAGE